MKQSLSDEQYVESIRKGIVSLKKWKPWLLALNMGIIVFYIVALTEIHNHLQQNVNQLQRLLPGQNLGNQVAILFGILGLGIGVHIGKVIHSIGEIIWGNRSDDLLVRYYDLVRQDSSGDITETEP